MVLEAQEPSDWVGHLCDRRERQEKTQMTLHSIVFTITTLCGLLIVSLGVHLEYQVGVETLGFKKKESPKSNDVSDIVHNARRRRK